MWLQSGQVIAPLLIILRVAPKSASTSHTIASVCIGEFKARSRGELTGGGGVLPCGEPTSSADERRMKSSELAIGVGTTYIDLHQDRVRWPSNPDALPG